MPTECSAKSIAFAPVDGRRVVADFGGGAITSNAGALLLGAADRAIGLIEPFAVCFKAGPADHPVVHDVSTLVGQRMLGRALGYEDLIDHEELLAWGRSWVWCSGDSRRGTVGVRHCRQEHARPARTRYRDRPLSADRA